MVLRHFSVVVSITLALIMLPTCGLFFFFKVRESTGNPAPLPLFVKIAPDLMEHEKREIASVVMDTKARDDQNVQQINMRVW